MKKTVIALLALFASGTSLAATPWQKITQPISGSPQSIGAFANGCIVGAQALPLNATGYQVGGITSAPYEKKGLFSFLHK